MGQGPFWCTEANSTFLKSLRSDALIEGLRMLVFAHDIVGARTEFAAAEPHCPESLRDWLHQMEQVTASGGEHH
jgi:hypothetical protein